MISINNLSRIPAVTVLDHCMLMLQKVLQRRWRYDARCRAIYKGFRGRI